MIYYHNQLLQFMLTFYLAQIINIKITEKIIAAFSDLK